MDETWFLEGGENVWDVGRYWETSLCFGVTNTVPFTSGPFKPVPIPVPECCWHYELHHTHRWRVNCCVHSLGRCHSVEKEMPPWGSDLGSSLYHQWNSSFRYKEERSDWSPESSIFTSWCVLCLMSRFSGCPSLNNSCVPNCRAVFLSSLPFPRGLKWLQMKWGVWREGGGGWSYFIYLIAQI